MQDLVILMMGRRERYRADWGGRPSIEYSTYARLSRHGPRFLVWTALVCYYYTIH